VASRRLIEPARAPATQTDAKTRQHTRAAWADDRARVGVRHVLVGELLCRAVDVHAGERVLDVAAGSGNAALAAARRGARVIASDIARVALERARQRADAEGLALHTELADAQALPFDDGAFDIVLSTFGAMFAPDQQQVADELTRVCRPGGRIGLANWTPEGLVGSSLAIIDQHVPSAPAAAAPRSPSAWGTTVRLRELLGDQVAELRTRRGSTDVCAASAADLVAFNRACAGPTRAAFAQLDQAGQERLASDLTTDLERFNRARDGTFAAAAEYLQATTVRAIAGRERSATERPKPLRSTLDSQGHPHR
jgi:2-polyprenyl-3-methyl-5-hydroxy-6-metoxy-1,4-benzoquinol methylase